MLHWSQEAFVSSLALSLLHALWQGALLGLVGLALHGRLKRATPDVRCGAYFLLLLTIFAVWLGTFASLYAAQIHPAAVTSDASAGAVIMGLSPMPHAAVGPAPLMSSLHPLLPALVAAWALGVCVLSLRHFGGFLLLNRLCKTESAPCPPAWEVYAARLAARMEIRRRISLRCSARIDVPCAFGLFRSYVLLPLSALTGLAPDQAEALIAHELAHFARHDVLLNFVQICMETVLFYHPAVRWLSVQIRAAREQQCDDLVIQVIGDRALYARALYSLEEARTSIPRLALGAKGDTSDMTDTLLIRRIRRVLGVSDPERRDPWAKGALALGAAAIGLAALLPIHAYSQTSAPGGKPSDTSSTTQTRTITSQVRTKVLLNIDGDKIELNTTHPTSDAPVTVNGKTGRFGDLSPTQQQQLHKALQAVPSHIDVKSFVFGSASDGSSDPSVHIMKSTKILMNFNGDKIELNTTDPNPETPVTVNGKTGRFGDLTPTQQQQIREHLSKVHIHVLTTNGSASLPPDVMLKVKDAMNGMDLPEGVKVQVIERVTSDESNDSPAAPAPKP